MQPAKSPASSLFLLRRLDPPEPSLVTCHSLETEVQAEAASTHTEGPAVVIVVITAVRRVTVVVKAVVRTNHLVIPTMMMVMSMMVVIVMSGTVMPAVPMVAVMVTTMPAIGVGRIGNQQN